MKYTEGQKPDSMHSVADALASKDLTTKVRGTIKQCLKQYNQDRACLWKQETNGYSEKSRENLSSEQLIKLFNRLMKSKFKDSTSPTSKVSDTPWCPHGWDIRGGSFTAWSASNLHQSLRYGLASAFNSASC